MLKIKFIIPQEANDGLQTLAIRVEGQKKIIKEIITDSSLNPAVLRGSAFTKYNENYIKDSGEFDSARTQLEQDFVPEELRALGEDTVWELSYHNRTMIITVNSDKFDNTWEDIKFNTAAENIEVQVLANVTPVGCGCSGNCR